MPFDDPDAQIAVGLEQLFILAVVRFVYRNWRAWSALEGGSRKWWWHGG